MKGSRWIARCDAAVVRRAAWVALVVGPVLVLINQGSSLWSGEALDVGKAALTTVVPFLVSCFSGIAAERDACDERPPSAQRTE